MSRTGLASANAAAGSSLLKTKLQIPAIHPPLIARPRLTARLDSDYPLTMIIAPPGSGKTTLLVEWALGCLSAAWLTLDDLDNDLHRFLTHLIGAVQVRDALDLDNADPPEVTITAALNALDEAPQTLVLDNYHLISNAAIHSAVSFIVDHLPACARLILAGRTCPPLPLARWRLAGTLAQMDDLSFTTGEAAEFLGLAPHDASAHVLTERTGGWITGLQLAALWLRAGADARDFSARYRHVHDYFMQEVFAPQTAAIQDFLVRTAILNPLGADVCNALTGRSDGQAMLERLEQLNLFVEPLDEQRRAYRYHPLFAEFLRDCLSSQGGSGDLHLRASVWYERSGALAAAVEHALDADAWERASALIERCAESGVDVTRWRARLPDDLPHPSLAAPLSERETEILHLILTGLSNPEIAHRLIIAVSTVKTHVKSIYRKLDVDTRYEAMQRARELNLLQISMERDYRRLIK